PMVHIGRVDTLLCPRRHHEYTQEKTRKPGHRCSPRLKMALKVRAEAVNHLAHTPPSVRKRPVVYKKRQPIRGSGARMREMNSFSRKPISANWYRDSDSAILRPVAVTSQDKKWHRARNMPSLNEHGDRFAREVVKTFHLY